MVSVAKHVMASVAKHALVSVAKHVMVSVAKHVTVSLTKHVMVSVAKHVIVFAAKHAKKLPTSRNNGVVSKVKFCIHISRNNDTSLKGNGLKTLRTA